MGHKKYSANSTFTAPHGPHNKDPTAEDFETWLNLNSFAARVLARDLVLWKQFPVWQLREALENDIDPKSEVFKNCLAVAAEWIKQSGSFIWERWVADFEDSDYKEDSQVGPQPLYTGRTGLCPERWNFWKHRFGEISKLEGLDDARRAVAVEAKKRMESIEDAVSGQNDGN